MGQPKAVFQASEFELRDEAYKLISHLHAQTMLICGEGLENFSNHSDEIKSNYLWSMCDLAERSLMLISRMQTSPENVKGD